MTIKIELTNIKHAAFSSEETHCYSATLIVDGVKLGTVSNDGHGGCDMFHPAPGKSWDDYKAADARCAAELPGFDLAAYGSTGIMAASLEGECSERVNEWLRRRDLRRLLGRSLVYFKTRPTAPGAPMYAAKLVKGHPVAAHALRCKQANPEAVVLNVLPEDEALALFAMAA